MFIEYFIIVIAVIVLICYIIKDSNSLKNITFTSDNKEVHIPTRATDGSAGYDFYLPKTIVIDAHSTNTVDSYIKVKIPKNHVLLLFPRSSLGIKNHIILANTTGVIDSDYKDTIKLPLHNYDKFPIVLNKGERVAQGICVPYITSKDKPLSTKRNGGIGSTGRY